MRLNTVTFLRSFIPFYQVVSENILMYNNRYRSYRSDGCSLLSSLDLINAAHMDCPDELKMGDNR